MALHYESLISESDVEIARVRWHGEFEDPLIEQRFYDEEIAPILPRRVALISSLCLGTTSVYISLEPWISHRDNVGLRAIAVFGCLAWILMLALAHATARGVVAVRTLESAWCVLYGLVAAATMHGSRRWPPEEGAANPSIAAPVRLFGDFWGIFMEEQCALVVVVVAVPMVPRTFSLLIAQFAVSVAYTRLNDGSELMASAQRTGQACALVEVVFFAMLTMFVCITLARIKRQSYFFYMAVRASAAEAIERARAEKQREQEAMQLEAAKLARSRLIRMVMHDLRSPLLSVLNTTATLMELHPSTPLRDADVLQGFEVLNTCTTLMENIVSDMLDFERIDAGRLLLAKAPFLVTQLLDDARRTFGGLAEVKGIALESDVDPRLRELLLLGDARRLQQCLNNGISNALKFSERGTRVTIRALYAEVESPSRSRRDGALRSSKADADAPSSEASAVGVGGARVRVLVQDEGVGIDESELAVLNEGVAFAQVGAGQLQGKGGSGLGLLITRQLLALHSDDSRLRISSDGPGKGMTFELDMQLERACMPALSEGLLRAAIAEAHAAPPAAAAVASHPSAATSSCASPQTTVRSAAASDAGATPASPGPLWLPAGFRCLYVDDDAELCRTLPQRLFGPSAIAFDIARDGAEAVRLALGDDKGKYGLILMDHKMPRLSGALATRALRTGGYAGKLVGMMADDGLDLRCPERDEFVAAGLNACVEKRGELESYVRTMLRDMSDDLAAGGLGVAPDHASLDDAQSNHSGSGRFVRRFDAAVAVARRMSKPAARSPSWLEENRPSEPRADRPRDGSAYTSEGEEAPLFESRPAPLPGARRQRASSLMSAYLGAPPLSPLRRRSQPLAMPAGFRALHVDDDKTLQRSTVLRLFKPLNVPHDLAQNGREALDRILGAEGAPGAPYDLVMLDNQMPVMGGTQAARALRAAGFKGVIVGLTGDPHGCVERDEFDASGVDLTLDKGSSAIALLLAMLRDLAVRGLFDSRAQPVVVMREFLCTHAVKYADTARVVASSGAGGANPNLSNVPIR